MTLDELREQAKRIESEVDTILGEMVADISYGAVNWADLMCVDVSVSLTGQDLEWTATVEEASPDASKFCIVIADKLAERGFPNVYVRTEW